MKIFKIPNGATCVQMVPFGICEVARNRNEDIYCLCYIRGVEGLLIGLSEQLGKK